MVVVMIDMVDGELVDGLVTVGVGDGDGGDGGGDGDDDCGGD